MNTNDTETQPVKISFYQKYTKKQIALWVAFVAAMFAMIVFKNIAGDATTGIALVISDASFLVSVIVVVAMFPLSPFKDSVLAEKVCIGVALVTAFVSGVLDLLRSAELLGGTDGISAVFRVASMITMIIGALIDYAQKRKLAKSE